jgi:spermidine synthase
MTFKLPAVSKQGISRSILYLVLFCSGLSALVYQIVWIRKFGLVFGVHVFSMTTVLTAFMAGLALGSLYFGRLVDRRSNPLRLFLFLELGIGVFAALFPLTFNVLSDLYGNIAVKLTLHQYLLQLVRFALAFIYLLIPTTLMGGTMPVIIRIFVDNLGEVGGKVSRLYAMNNLGAVVGGFLAGFITIRAIGLYPSAYLAAAINAINVFLVFLIARRNKPGRIIGRVSENKKSSGSVSGTGNILSPGILKLVLWVFAIEGFTTLAYEILWARILVDFSLDKTTYFASVIVISFVFGLSLGSFMISRVIDRHRNLLSLLGFIEIFIGLLSIFLLLVFTWMAPKIAMTRSMFGEWIIEAGREYLFFFALLLPPVVLMGFTYPLVSKLINDNMERLGRQMGFLGFLDTIGSVIGSFVAGFIMIPFIGVVKSFVFIVIINLLLGLLVLYHHPSIKRGLKAVFITSTLVVASFLFSIMPRSPYTRTWWDKQQNKPWFDANRYNGLLFFDEGAAGTVTVRDYPEGLALNINGHNTAYATKKDLKVNRQLGYMPYLLHSHPKTALVIGFGMGATACSLNQPDMERVDVAEICNGVIKAAYIFNDWNRDVLHQPKVTLFDDDGRSVVNNAPEKYDIITSNAIHPRLSNNIYTRDFYELCYNKLTDDGILCQWLPENWMSEEEYKSLVKAFTDAFPHSTMWYVNEYSTLLIGMKKPVKIDVSSLVNKFGSNEWLRRDFAEFGLFSPYEFIGQFWMTEKDLAKYVENCDVNTDNKPLVEFSRVINLAPVPGVMEFLINHEIRYDEVLINLGREMEADKELQMIEKYAFGEKQRMQSILNVTRAYMKHAIN